MDIKCMGTVYSGDPIPHKLCLQCAATEEADCGYDLLTLMTLFERDTREGIHVTDLTGCMRKSYLQKTSPVAQYPSQMLMMKMGTLVHSMLEHEGPDFTSEIPIEAEGIVGTADLFYIKTGKVVDFKTTRWLNPSNLPYGNHALQINIYSYLLKKMGYKVKSLWIQYIDLSGPTKCRACKVPVVPMVQTYSGSTSATALICPHCSSAPRNAHLGAVMYEVPMENTRALGNVMRKRRDAMQNALYTGATPEAEPSFLCKGYCPFLYQCPEGEMFAGHS